MNYSIDWTPFEGDVMVDVSITISNIKGMRRDKMVTLLNDFMSRLEVSEVCTTESKEDDPSLVRKQNVENHQDQARQRYLRKRSRDRYMHSYASVVSRDRKQTQRLKQNDDKSMDHNNPPLCQAPTCAYNCNTRSHRKDRPSRIARDTLHYNQNDNTI